MPDVCSVTTPIYYANAAPHIGTLYTTVVADFLARFHRVLGDDTLLVTGSDEHGEKIYQAALHRQESPQEFVDQIAAGFQQAWQRFGIGVDVFVRTTSPQHQHFVQAALAQVYAAGELYFDDYEGHYCVGCERFLTEKELVDGCCPDHGTPPESRREGNWVLRMEPYRDWLREVILCHPAMIAPERYRNEALGMLAEPIGDLSISRPRERVPWGIPLPWDHRQVTYVWFDALLSYRSGLDDAVGDDAPRFWLTTQHLIGKDILKPHAIFWPIMLRALGVPLYRRLLLGGYLLGPDGRKMSKSRGNVVDPFALAERFGVDAVRYYLLREFPYGQDGSVSVAALSARYHADLANTLGNLVHRVRAMVLRYRGGIVPAAQPAPADHALIDEGTTLAARMQPLVAELRTHQALDLVVQFLQGLNRYVDEQQPWQLAKRPDQASRLDTVLANLVEGLRLACAALEPAMPGKAAEIRQSLGFPPASSACPHTWMYAARERHLPPEAPVLFPRVEHEP